MNELALVAEDIVIVLINVDSPIGHTLGDALMPHFDWQSIRDRGEVPFARGLAMRGGIQDVLDTVDRDIGDKLRTMKAGPAVVVVDHFVVEAFEASELPR